MPSLVSDRRFGVSAGVAVKAPVRAAATSAITLNGTQTIDGVAVVAGDRVLVKNQVDGVENGVYDVSTGPWTRAVDFDGVRDVVSGTRVYVAAGTINGGGEFVVSTEGAITPGQTSISFAAVDSPAIAATYALNGVGAVERTLQDRLEETYYVADFASGPEAAKGAFTAGARLHVKAGETAYLTCDPTAGDDIRAMADWMQACSKEETAVLYILLAGGGHAISTYIDVTGPGLPLEIRAAAEPDEIEIVSIAYAAVSGSVYRATIGLAAEVPAAYAAGDPVGIQMPIGDNDASAAAGGQILQSIAGDRLSFAFDFWSANGLPIAPTTLTAGATLSVANNRAILPKAWLRCAAIGWGTGLQREGFLNCMDGGRARLVDIGLAYVGDSGLDGSNHDLLFGSEAGSRVYLERVVAAGAGDKVLRTFQGAEIRSNNSCIGGAAKADELYQGVAGGSASFVRTSLGGARLRGVTAGAGTHVQTSAALLASCSDGVTVTGAGASVAWRVSRVSNCVNGVRQANGIVELDDLTGSLIERCTNGVRRSEASGEVIGTPNYSGNGVNDSLQSAHPGLNFGGAAAKNLLDHFESGTYTPTLTNQTNVASSTASITKVLRIGSAVVVSGEVLIDPAAGADALTEIGISLPHAADIANARDVSGIAASDQSAALGNAAASIRGDAANDRATLRFYAGDAAARTWTFRFEYKAG